MNIVIFPEHLSVMSKFKQLKNQNQEKIKSDSSEQKSNYNLQFQIAVLNWEHNILDEKVPILRKLA